MTVPRFATLIIGSTTLATLSLSAGVSAQQPTHGSSGAATFGIAR